MHLDFLLAVLYHDFTTIRLLDTDIYTQTPLKYSNWTVIFLANKQGLGCACLGPVHNTSANAAWCHVCVLCIEQVSK